MPISILLPKLDALATELRRTNSVLEKKKILSNHPDTHHFLRCLFNSGPLYITSKSISKTVSDEKIKSKSFDFLEDLVESLSAREISGNAAIGQVQSLIQKYPVYKDLIKDIIDKDLRIRMGSKLVLSSIILDTEDPKLPVALAKDWKDEKIRSGLVRSLEMGEVWFASRKLDGVRCLAVIERRDSQLTVSLRSRQGKNLDRLRVIRDAIAQSFHGQDLDGPMVLDGELCCFEDDPPNINSTKESFRKAAGLVGRSESGSTESLIFVVFDLLQYEELSVKSRLLSERLDNLNSLKPFEHLMVLPQARLTSRKDFEVALAKSRQYGWEGLMVRKDGPYHGRRSCDLIKCKDFTDAEFRIVGYKTGLMRTISDGIEKAEDMLLSITIEYKGCKVDVGSGFSIEERRQFKEIGQGLVGQLATICYFEETSNKIDDKPSLRFPVFKSLCKPV